MSMNLNYPCALCAKIDLALIRPYPGFKDTFLVKCRGCGLMQSKPIPSDAFLSEYYRSEFGKDSLCGHQMNESSEKGFTLRARMQFDFIHKNLRLKGFDTLKVLDVGCHAASLLNLFKQRGSQIVGIDPNPRGSKAKEWYDIEVRQAMFSPNLFGAEEFDGIMHSHVLEHLSDPLSVLKEFRRILKPGGWVFIEVPNESHETVLTKEVIPHLFFFTPDTLKALSLKAGFEVVNTCVIGVPSLKGRLLSRRGFEWMRVRSKARYNALGQLNLLTFLPMFGRIFCEDRYFKGPQESGTMLRILLRRPHA